jgi:nucleoside-diphosphate-sugar epimerase
MKIFLTGGTGFIGTYFIKEAIQNDFEIIALNRKLILDSKKHPDIDAIWLFKDMELVQTEDFKDVDVLVHLAAHSANVPYDSLENCIQQNVVEPIILFKKAAAAGVKKFVVAGSCFEYGKSGERFDFIPVDGPLEPTQTYPASKALSSIAFYQFAIEYQIQLSYHRIFQVYGEGEAVSRLWPSLKKAALSGANFPMTEGLQIRDFIAVEDVAKYFVEACLNKDLIAGQPEVCNVGSGKPQSILEFSEYWWQKWQAKGKLLKGKLPYREGEVMRYVPKI